MEKPLDSPASFQPISLTSTPKLFEHIMLFHLLFFLESNSILSPHQASFSPGQSTLNQILLLSQSISNGFNKPRLSSWMIPSTIDFLKAFDSVQGRRLRACGHATHARTFDYTQHMEVRYKLESVEKQHKQARVYINGPQTLIKRSPEVMGCSPKC